MAGVYVDVCILCIPACCTLCFCVDSVCYNNLQHCIHWVFGWKAIASSKGVNSYAHFSDQKAIPLHGVLLTLRQCMPQSRLTVAITPEVIIIWHSTAHQQAGHGERVCQKYHGMTSFGTAGKTNGPLIPKRPHQQGVCNTLSWIG